MASPGGESMRPYMRMQNLVVRETDTGLAREVVLAELSKHCSPAQGKVVVPVSEITGGILGIAYLHYHNAADGEPRGARGPAAAGRSLRGRGAPGGAHAAPVAACALPRHAVRRCCWTGAC